MPKTFSRKCRWCDSIFNHWRSAWNHEKKCPIRFGQAEVLEKSTAWQKPGWHGPELTLEETFKGFTNKEGE